MNNDILTLGIESSCDETAVAVVKNGREVLSNIIDTQIKIHEKYGGVVPEIASRNHIEAISRVTLEALEEANVDFKVIDAITPTYGPGLVGALLVGLSYGRGLSLALKKPLVRSKSHRRSYCCKLHNTQRFKATIFMLGNFRGTYSFGICKRIY